MVDIPNTFIQTDIKKEDTVIIRLKGKPAELLVRTAPELYRKYITFDKRGKPVLYVEAWKAIYGTLKAALLFYLKLRKDLEKKGFIINPYDPCIANKKIGEKQMTIAWHVDDLKVTHVDSKEVDKFVEWIRDQYEDPEIGKVKISRGKVHDYLGMVLDFTIPGNVQINMKKYVEKMVDDFPETLESKVTTPAALHLFNVRDNVKVLEEEHAMLFHNLTARGLFLCKRARPDIQTAVAFLTTRVKQPDCDDWKKLQRMINYLKCTRDLVITLSANDAHVLKWYVDVAYAVHKDMKSHTGGAFTMGKGT